jgi:effector-binding domain-containing protein
MKKLWIIFAVVLTVCAPFVLAQISVQVEPQAPKTAPKCEIVGQIEVKTIPAATLAIVLEKAVDYAPEGGYKTGPEGMMAAYANMMTKGFEKLGAWMGSGGMPMGPPLAIFFEDPEKASAKDLTCKIAFPTMADAKATAPVMIEPMPEYTAVVCTYKGPYEESGDIWKQCDKWVKDNGYINAGAPMEVYLVSEAQKVAPADYITEIRIPVKKTETKPAEGNK